MIRRTKTTTAAAAALAVALVGCGSSADGGGGSISDAVEIELLEQNASGITGIALLAPKGDKTNVVIEMIQPFDIDPQPAHIHKGTCASLDPKQKPAYMLSILEDGVGGGDVDASLDELREGGYAIDVHRSEKESDVLVACGEIT